MYYRFSSSQQYLCKPGVTQIARSLLSGLLRHLLLALQTSVLRSKTRLEP